MPKKTYTTEEKAAFAQRNRELAEAADAALAGPDAGAKATAIALRSPKLAAYSLRNQMMLAHQAEEAGIDLRDVDTARGWRERGRTIRKGSRALLRIVYPIRRGPGTDADTEGDGETAGATLFRTKAVFEVGQTTELADSAPDLAGSEGDPAEIWRERLGREADKLDYTIEHTEPEGSDALATIDAEARTITVSAADTLAPESLSALAQRIAEVQAAAKAAGTAPRATASGAQTEPEEGTVLEFD